MMSKTIGCIGCGNMGRAMVEGIMKAKYVDGDAMMVSNLHPERLVELKRTYGLVVANNVEVASKADILILAVKPYMYPVIITEIKDVVKADVIIVNIGTGIGNEDVYSLFDRKIKVVKAIPNMPSMVQEAMSAVVYGELLSEEDKQWIKEVFETFGKTCEVTPSLLTSVSVVSGCSPAYVFMFIEALADGAVLQGMPRADAYVFAAQAVLGAAKVVLETGKHPGALKDMVCSPGGTAIEAVIALEESGFRGSILSAMNACAMKSKAMSKK